MEDIATNLTFSINIAICFFLARHYKKKLIVKEIKIKKAKWLYSLFVLVASLFTSIFILWGLTVFFENLGFIQEFGHPGPATTFVLNVIIGIIMIPIGLIIINWQPMQW